MDQRLLSIGEGELSATSNEAVTGAQLFRTNENVSGALRAANAAASSAGAATTTANEAKTQAGNAVTTAGN
ncbi:MAG: hypothetical protein ACN6OP_02615, partial [Pseudomonadales bacterium]